MPVAAPADKRFRRAHVTPMRKRLATRISWSRAVQGALLLGIILYAGYFATNFVLSTGVLTVTRIAVSGNSWLSRGEVLSLLEGLQGKNMVTLNLEPWRRKLRSSPWVADAAIRRVLPNTVTVAISERQPLGIARISEGLYLVDSRGVIDEFGSNYADFDLPLIDGLAAVPGEGGGLVDERRAALAARLLSAVQARPDIAKRISQIDVADGTDAAVILKGDTALVRLGTDHFTERLQSYLDLRTALRERVPEIDYVDLRFDERIYVRPQGSRPRPQTGLKAQGLGLRRDALKPKTQTRKSGG